MRIFSSADLHLGVERQGDESVWRMARYLNRVGAQDDVLTLNGDLGTEDRTVNACLEMFSRFPGIKLVVPGNHDIWVTEKECVVFISIFWIFFWFSSYFYTEGFD